VSPRWGFVGRKKCGGVVTQGGGWRLALGYYLSPHSGLKKGRPIRGLEAVAPTESEAGDVGLSACPSISSSLDSPSLHIAQVV
jgi:hypothetical protein